jgi:hypothetical protein
MEVIPMPLDFASIHLSPVLAAPPLAWDVAAVLLQSAADDVNRITAEFLRFGQRIAAGVCALAILVGFIMIGTAHGNPARADHGWGAVVAGLGGLVGVALVSGVVAIVKAVFPVLN